MPASTDDCRTPLHRQSSTHSVSSEERLVAQPHACFCPIHSFFHPLLLFAPHPTRSYRARSWTTVLPKQTWQQSLPIPPIQTCLGSSWLARRLLSALIRGTHILTPSSIDSQNSTLLPASKYTQAASRRSRTLVARVGCHLQCTPVQSTTQSSEGCLRTGRLGSLRQRLIGRCTHTFCRHPLPLEETPGSDPLKALWSLLKRHR